MLCFAYMTFSPGIGQAKSIAFALIGDSHHSPDTSRIALTQTLVTEAGITIDFTTDTAQLNATTLNGYKLLILFKDGMRPDNSFWMTVSQGTAIKRFVENGGSILFFHQSSHLALTNDSVKAVLGGVYAGHPAIRQFNLHITDTSSPMTKGVSDFTVTDEQHYPNYYADSSHIFMTAVNPNGLTFKDDDGVERGTTSIAGWAFSYGMGKVCYLSPGHTLASLRNPEYVKMQKNAVAWLLTPVTAVANSPAAIQGMQRSSLSIQSTSKRFLTIEWVAAKTGFARISFFNPEGCKVWTLQKALVSGANTFTVSTAVLSPGINLCIVETKGARIFQKITFLR